MKTLFKKPMVKNTTLAVGTLACTVALITGCGGPKSAFINDLHKFYPQSTNYFVELNPSEADIKNFAKAVEALEAKSGSSQLSQFNIIEKYGKNFEPKMAFGAWLEASKSPETPTASHVLASIHVKNGVSLESLEKEMGLPKGEFTTLETKKGAVKALKGTSEGKPMVMALYNNTLLISEAEKDITDAIELESTNGKNIASSELVSKSLGLIPSKREGTFVSSQSPELVEKLIKKTGAPASGIEKFAEEISPAASTTTASLDFDETKSVFSAEAVSLFDFSKIKNPDLRRDLEAAYTEGSPVAIADLVGENSQMAFSVYGLSKYFNMYEKYFATAQEKKQIEDMQAQLKMMNLDFRKNFVGLFDETFGLDIINPQSMEVALFANSNPDTKKGLEMLAKTILRATPTEKDFNGKKLQLIQSPGLPIQFAFGEIQPKLMLIGTLPAIQLLPVTNNQAKPLGTNKLYQELGQGLPKTAFAFLFIDAEKMNKNAGPMNEAQELGIKGAVFTATPEKANSLFRSHLRLKWSDITPATSTNKG